MSERRDGEAGHSGGAGRSRGIGVLVGLAAFALLLATGVLAGGEIPFGSGSESSSGTRAPETLPTQPTVRPAEPTKLVVRSVGIEATVRPVALSDDLALRPPRQPELVGWWDGSAEPGATKRLRGGTVIAGHTVHDPDDDGTRAAGPNGAGDGAGDSAAESDGADRAERRAANASDDDPGGGAMDRLPEVAEGARVVVRTENGSVRYRVSRVERLSKADLAERSERIFDQRGRHRLVLVTCEDWNGEEYLSNVVIFAQPLPAAA